MGLDERFVVFFRSVKEECTNRCDPPVLPRQRQLPRRINDGIAQHVFSSVEGYFCKEYFEAIDIVKGDLEKTFKQRNFLIVQKVEKLFIECANGRSFTIPQEIDIHDIDFSKLNLHLKMLPHAIKSTPLNGIHIKEVTKISTICDVFIETPSMKKLLCEVHTLLKIYLTIPVTTQQLKDAFLL